VKHYAVRLILFPMSTTTYVNIGSEHICNTREGQGPDRSVVPSRKIKCLRGGRKEGGGRGAAAGGGAEEDSA
jgi:hypothetical protein